MKITLTVEGEQGCGKTGFISFVKASIDAALKLFPNEKNILNCVEVQQENGE